MRKLFVGVFVPVVWLVGAQVAAAQLTPGFVEVSGSPFATGSSPRSVAFSPNGAFVATANLGASTVSVFSVSSGGSLTAVSGSPFPTGNAPASVAFSSSGALVAVANRGASSVSVFSVASGGSLTAVSGSPFPTGAGPDSVAFSPSELLAVANGGDNTVSVFSVTSNGSLTAVSGSPFATGAAPDSVAFNQLLQPLGGYHGPYPELAVASGAADSVSKFFVHEGVDTTNGVVTRLGPAGTFPTGAAPASVAFSPSDLLAVADRGDNTVSVFSINPSEGGPYPGGPDALVPLPGSPLHGSAAGGPASAVFSPGGGLLATANATTSNVSVFSVVDCSARYNQGFNAGINSGYHSGFNAGWNRDYGRAWKVGFKLGFRAARRRSRTVHSIGRSARIAVWAPLAYGQRDSAEAATGCDAWFDSAFNQTVSVGANYFNNGFTSGWNSAYKPGLNQGFRAGFAQGRPRR